MTQYKGNNIILVNQETETTAAAKPQFKDTLMSFAPLVLIFAIFYFFVIRPQVRKQKEQANLISSAKKGDRVIVAGGIIGKIVKEVDDIVVVEIAKDTNIEVLKSTIASILNKKDAAVADTKPVKAKTK